MCECNIFIFINKCNNINICYILHVHKLQILLNLCILTITCVCTSPYLMSLNFSDSNIIRALSLKHYQRFFFPACVCVHIQVCVFPERLTMGQVVKV